MTSDATMIDVPMKPEWPDAYPPAEAGRPDNDADGETSAHSTDYLLLF